MRLVVGGGGGLDLESASSLLERWGGGLFLLALSSGDLFLPLGLSLQVVLVSVLFLVLPSMSELLLTSPISNSVVYGLLNKSFQHSSLQIIVF